MAIEENLDYIKVRRCEIPQRPADLTRFLPRTWASLHCGYRTCLILSFFFTLPRVELFVSPVSQNIPGPTARGEPYLGENDSLTLDS